MNTRFTIEEENIVAIYAEDSRETTLENILAAMPYMDAVSYTHLDVYKRQTLHRASSTTARALSYPTQA